MRSLVTLSLAVTFSLAVSAAHAQGTFGGPAKSHAGFGGGYKPDSSPKSYELPKPYEAPKPRSYEPPAPKPIEPFKPYKGVDTNTAPSGLYPELHRKKKGS